MDETKAREILGKWIQPDGSLYCGAPWVSSGNGETGFDIELDGCFHVDELEAVIWWMRNKLPQPGED